MKIFAVVSALLLLVVLLCAGTVILKRYLDHTAQLQIQHSLHRICQNTPTSC